VRIATVRGPVGAAGQRGGGSRPRQARPPCRYDEAATTRAEHLEAAIVILIVFEIVLAFIL
jgi:hypothetical protein